MSNLLLIAAIAMLLVPAALMLVDLKRILQRNMKGKPMNEEQLNALQDWLEAVVEEKIGDALGRDTLHESLSRMELEKEMRVAILGEDANG